MRDACRTLALLLLIAVCAATTLAPAASAAETTPIGASPTVIIPDDPNSKFRAGNLWSVTPLEIVEVPIYLDTASQVAFINCRLAWLQSQLHFVDVVAGPGAPPAGGTFTVDPEPVGGGGIGFSYSTDGFGPLLVPANTPIAYLHVEVQCGFYWDESWVEFFEDGGSADNFYTNASGIPLAPLRQSGFVSTLPNWNYLIGPNATALPSQDIVEVPLRWLRTLPGRPLRVVLQYDTAKLGFVSVANGEGMPAAILDPVVGSGVIDIEITSDQLPAEGSDEILLVTFEVLGDADNYTTSLTALAGTSFENLCGVVTEVTGGAGNITVPNHVADVDIGDIGAYTNATYYDVPVTLDSNFPAHDFEFWMTFPSAQLQFVGPISVSPFPLPSIWVDAGNPNLLNINAGSPLVPGDPVAHSADLPAVIFKMRFAPVTPPPAGTVFPIQFQQPNPQNRVEYYIHVGPPLVSSFADLTLHNGSITISSPPNPGCPTLFSWDGGSLRRENTLLAACDGVSSPGIVTDHYVVRGQMQPQDGALRFQIREDETQVTEFHELRLLAVEHGMHQPLEVTAEGQFVLLDQPYSVAWARTQSGEDVTGLVQSQDGMDYSTESSGWLDVSFGKVRPEELGGRTAALMALNRPKLPPPPPALDKQGTTPAPGSKLIVSVRGGDGAWHRIAANDARLVPVQQATLLDPQWIAADRELVVRYEWDGAYRVDHVEFRAAQPFEGAQVSLPLLSARHSATGDVLDAFALGAKDTPIVLAPGQSIDVRFDASRLPALADGVKRSFVFVATGRYEDDAVQHDGVPTLRYALMPNVPNPFNPATTIRFTLPQAQNVRLTVHDLRGALVRTLVSGQQPAGAHEVVWDGRSDDGKSVASGTYLYRIDTPRFQQSRKMVLVQ